MTNYKAHFSRSLQAAPGRLHFAAHSHHLWPDVTFDAQVACWEDAARLADRKWERVFGEVVPQTQQAIARVLGLSSPDTIAFAPNTHELLCRLLSCLPVDRAAFPAQEWTSGMEPSLGLEDAGQCGRRGYRDRHH